MSTIDKDRKRAFATGTAFMRRYTPFKSGEETVWSAPDLSTESSLTPLWCNPVEVHPFSGSSKSQHKSADGWRGLLSLYSTPSPLIFITKGLNKQSESSWRLLFTKNENRWKTTSSIFYAENILRFFEPPKRCKKTWIWWQRMQHFLNLEVNANNRAKKVFWTQMMKMTTAEKTHEKEHGYTRLHDWTYARTWSKAKLGIASRNKSNLHQVPWNQSRRSWDHMISQQSDGAK